MAQTKTMTSYPLAVCKKNLYRKWVSLVWRHRRGVGGRVKRHDAHVRDRRVDGRRLLVGADEGNNKCDDVA